MYERFATMDNVFVTDGNVTDYDEIRRFVTGYHIDDGRVAFDPTRWPSVSTSNQSPLTVSIHRNA